MNCILIIYSFTYNARIICYLVTDPWLHNLQLQWHQHNIYCDRDGYDLLTTGIVPRYFITYLSNYVLYFMSSIL